MMDLLKLMVPSIPWILIAIAGFVRMQTKLGTLEEEVNKLRTHRHAEDTKLTAHFLTQGIHGSRLDEHDRRINSLENSRRNS